jgi:hypothetical protein
MAYSQQALISILDILIALGLAATPVSKKKNPYRSGWQTETPRTREQIINAIINGEPCFSTAKNVWYTGKAYGVGVRTGEVSNGVVGLDVDDSENLLAHVSKGDLPKTVEWTSGKKGCRGLLYQLPDDVRLKCRNFTRKPLSEWDGVKSEGADLDIRYNRQQQVLPPSYHPTTGVYRWTNSPVDTPIAPAPQWLIDLIVYFADADERLKEEKEKQRAEQAERKRQRRLQKIANGSAKALSGSLTDLLDEAKSSLHWSDVYDLQTTSEDGGKVKAYCPIHGGKSGTGFQVDTHTGAFFCHGCQEGGHFVDYLTFIDGLGTGLKGSVIAPYIRKVIELAGFTQEEIKKATERELTEEELAAKRAAQQAKWLSGYGFSGKEIEGYLSLSPKDVIGKFVAINAAQAVGKTTAIVALTKQQRFFDKIIFLGVNNTLLIQVAEKARGIHFRQDDPDFKRAGDPTGNFFLCLPSLHRLTPEQLTGCLVVLDEATAIVREFVDGSTVSSRPLPEQEQIVNNFHHLLSTSKGVIALDAYLNESTTSYLKALTPHLVTDKRKKSRIPKSKGVVNFHLGAIKEGELKSKDFTPILKRIIEALQRGQKIAIASDSQKTCEALDRMLSARGFKGLRIDSTTVPEDDFKEILKHPNETILTEQYDYLIYSPSAMSGFDFNLRDYFDIQFGIFYGVLSADLTSQMVGRIRYPHERHVWVTTYGLGEGGFYSPRAVERTVKGFLKQFSTDVESNYDELIDALRVSLDARQACTERGRKNYERANLRECLKALLTMDGFEVADACEDVEEDDNELSILKGIKGEIKDEFAGAVYDDDDSIKSEEEYNEKKQGCNREDRPGVTRYWIKERLPRIVEDHQWSPQFIRWFLDHTESRSQAIRWWLFQNVDYAGTDSGTALSQRNGFRLYQFRSYLGEVRALKELGILDLFSIPRDKDDPEVLAVVEKWKTTQSIRDRLKGKQPNAKDPISGFKWLLKLFGLSLKCTGQNRTPEGVKRLYEISDDCQQEPEWRCVWRVMSESLTVRALEAGHNVSHGVSQAELKHGVSYINRLTCDTSICTEPDRTRTPRTRPDPYRNGMKDSALEWHSYLLAKCPKVDIYPPEDIRDILHNCLMLSSQCNDMAAFKQFAHVLEPATA